MVRRTESNTRARPNAARRHDPMQFDGSRNSEAHFISDTQLEWTSLNYRKEKAADLSPSRRRMVLIMFQKQYPYFPSLREIRDELIEGQIDHIRTECKEWNSDYEFKVLKSEYAYNW